MIPIGIIDSGRWYDSPYWIYIPGNPYNANIHVTATTSSDITIAWEVAKGITPILYSVYVKLHSDTVWPAPKAYHITSLSYTFTTNPSTLYDVYIEAIDNNSDTRNSEIVTISSAADTTAPSIPIGLTSSDITTSSFTLSWSASTDNVGVTGYKVYKDGVYYGSTSGLSMNITGLDDNTAYSMTVSAYDAVGNESSQSSALSVTTVLDTTPPAVTVNTNGFSVSDSDGSVAYGSTALSYSLTPTDVGIDVSCDVVLIKNTVQIDASTIILRDNTQYDGTFTLAVAADYSDDYVIQITKP